MAAVHGWPIRNYFGACIAWQLYMNGRSVTTVLAQLPPSLLVTLVVSTWHHWDCLKYMSAALLMSALPAQCSALAETTTGQHGQCAYHATMSQLTSKAVCYAQLQCCIANPDPQLCQGPTQSPQLCQRPTQRSQPHSLRQCSIADLHST